MLSIWLKVLHAGDLVIMALQSFIDDKLLALVPVPQFDGHITRTTSEVVASGVKSYIIYHSGVLT